MDMKLSSKGSSSITALLYILIGILLAYAGLKTIPAYTTYYSMDDELAQLIHTANVNPADVIQSDIMKKAQELDLLVKAEDVTLIKNDDESIKSVVVKWVYTVDYGYGFKRDFPFVIDSSKKMTK
jgi:hypothetical protein